MKRKTKFPPPLRPDTTQWHYKRRYTNADVFGGTPSGADVPQAEAVTVAMQEADAYRRLLAGDCGDEGAEAAQRLGLRGIVWTTVPDEEIDPRTGQPFHIDYLADENREPARPHPTTRFPMVASQQCVLCDAYCPVLGVHDARGVQVAECRRDPPTTDGWPRVSPQGWCITGFNAKVAR